MAIMNKDDTTVAMRCLTVWPGLVVLPDGTVRAVGDVGSVYRHHDGRNGEVLCELAWTLRDGRPIYLAPGWRLWRAAAARNTGSFYATDRDHSFAMANARQPWDGVDVALTTQVVSGHEYWHVVVEAFVAVPLVEVVRRRLEGAPRGGQFELAMWEFGEWQDARHEIW
jgi:hypothetical protein